jgi:hypothetical protein
MASGTDKSGDGPDAPDSSVVDETLIDAMLALSPEERLRHNDRMVRTILLLRQGLRAKSEGDGGPG